MDILSLKEEINELLNKEGISSSVFDIEESKYADLAVKAFRFKDKVHVIKEILESHEMVDSVSISGPYVNLMLSRERFSESVLGSAVLSEFGRRERIGKTLVLEHTSVNPTGPIHVGRFRNPVIGDSLRRIFDFLGWNVVTQYYVNDVGRQVALITLARKKGLLPDPEVARKFQDYSDKPDYQTFFVYVSAFKRSESDEEFKKEIDDMMKEAETGNEKLLFDLRRTAEFCLEGQMETLKRCGFVYDKIVFESDFLKNGRVWEIIDQLKEKKGLVKLENGALAIDLKDYGSPRDATVLLRPDGTSVYLTRDVAYHMQKLDEGDLILNVLGEDHKVEFNELKTILDILGKDVSKLDVVHFSFVNLEGKKMSTRRGETVPLDLVLDEGKQKALEIINEKNPDLENKEKIAEMIGLGAIKYALVKQEPMKQITFRWEDALDFEGDTGPYLQYSVVRAKSILRKGSRQIDTGIDSVTDAEWDLIKAIARFPEVVYKAGQSRKPNLVANYAYSLAKEFNEFYHKERVLGSDREGFRLAIVQAFANVLENSLYLIGIPVPERM